VGSRGSPISVRRLSHRLQLRSWLEEPIPNTDKASVHVLAAHLRARELEKGFRIVEWARVRLSHEHLGAAEERIDAIMGNAPAASEGVAKRATEAFREFYQGIGDLNEALVDVREKNLARARMKFLAGYEALRKCADTLQELVPAELRSQLAFLWGTISVTPSIAGIGSVTPVGDEPTSEGREI
jgi:hypothetical protein